LNGLGRNPQEGADQHIFRGNRRGGWPGGS
jgi:hypothetical protein